MNPLHRGAGQFPTIGRAALFGTFMDGIAPAVRDIRTAIGKLSASGADLYALGGRPPRGVDVFVAFSVAGGTGGGIFYDYLHLIGEHVPADPAAGEDLPAGADAVGVRARPGRRAGRRAQRGPGAARPVPPGRPAERRRRSSASCDSVHDQAPIDPEEVAVYYPGSQRIVMRPGTRADRRSCFPSPRGPAARTCTGPSSRW